MMGEPSKPRLDPLVGGLTRPPMMLGVPYVLFVVEFCVIVLIFINTKNLLMFLLLIPVHGIAYALTVRDNRFVDIILVRFGKCPVTRNHRFWGGDSIASPKLELERLKIAETGRAYSPFHDSRSRRCA